MKIKIKKLTPNAVIPSYSLDGDAAQDLTATSRYFDEFGNVVFGTGLAFEIPDGYVGLLFARSSNAKKDLILANSVGILDSNFRGEVLFKFKPSVVFFDDVQSESGKIGKQTLVFDDIVVPTIANAISLENYRIGERIGQILVIPIPKIEFEEVKELTKTNRKGGSFGSTGK